jgi:ribosomal protein L20A (L18A)
LDRNDTKKFKVTGNLAHQAKPKKRIDFSRTIEAEDAVHALDIYRQKLRGV